MRQSADIRSVSNVQLVSLCAKEPENGLAWDEFVNRFNRCIILCVIRILSAKSPRPLRLDESESGETIRELVQDVYLRLLENEGQALKRFQGQHEKSIYTYLARIATTVVLDHLRQELANKRAAQAVSWSEILNQDSSRLDVDQARSTTTGPSYTEYQLDEQVTIDDLRYQLNHILEGEQKQRDTLIFFLHVFDGLTAGDIASQEGIGLTQRGVESVLRRIKIKLREIMGGGANRSKAG
jgi:RNA polymerase sigma factor (sigma-70 family)